MDWKHYVLALPIALFLLFLAFSFAGDTSEVVAEDEPVAGYVLAQDCDDDSSDEKGDEDGDSSSEEEGDEDSESEDGDDDSSDEDCPEEEEGEDDED